jgi:hypothetical protein
LKDRHFNGQKKKNNNDQQNTIQKNKDWMNATKYWESTH